MLSGKDFSQCVHPRQAPRFTMALLLTAPFGLIVFIALVAIFPITLLFLLLIWIGARVAFAYIMGNTIRVSRYNFPRIHALTEEIKRELDYHKPVYVFVYQNGDFNALMRRFFMRRAIFLNSDVVDKGVTDAEVRWLIGRFLGYLRAQRRSGLVGALLRFTENLLLFNLWIYPWERAMVYTGDRVALRIIDGDIGSAVSAMQKVLVGRELGYSINPAGVVAQHEEVKGSLFAFLARLGSPFPHTTARYVDLIHFAEKKFPAQFARFVSENPDVPVPKLIQLRA
jgi:hypothetical protein